MLPEIFGRPLLRMAGWRFKIDGQRESYFINVAFAKLFENRTSIDREFSVLFDLTNFFHLFACPQAKGVQTYPSDHQSQPPGERSQYDTVMSEAGYNCGYNGSSRSDRPQR
jgi:hypothetical protein